LLWGAIPKQYNPYALHNGELFNSVGPGNLRFQYVQIFVIASAVALMIALTLLVRRTKIGKAMRATSFDLEAASMMGIDVDRVIAFTFFIGSALAGAAGVMSGIAFGNIQPYMGFGAGLKAFTAAVVGGIGNIQGAMLGGMIIGVGEQLTTGYLSSAFQDLIVLSILIVFMLFRPTGILGSPVLQKV
jgi:branched-chain amino acid transport system permease protein